MASTREMGNGKWRVDLCYGRKSDGTLNRTSRVITAKSKKDAEMQAQALEYEFRNGQVASIEVSTFNELVNIWREDGTDSLVVNTLIDWNDKLNAYILPKMGRMKIKDITSLHISRYLKSLKQDGIRRDNRVGGFSDQTILHHYTIINCVFNFGLKHELIQKNPCVSVDRPVVKRKKLSSTMIRKWIF